MGKISAMTLAAAALPTMEIEVNNSLVTEKITVAQLQTLILNGGTQVNNSLFVMINGSDVTGLRERLDKPFKTRAAAQAAALEGDTIFVFPGFYYEKNLGANGVNWVTFPGVKNYIDGALYSGTDISFDVSGSEDIYAPEYDLDNADVQVGNFTGSCLVSIEYGGFEARSGGNYISASDDSRIYITAKKRMYSLVHPNSNANVSNNAVVNINAPEMYFSAGIYTHDGSPEVNIYCPRMIFDNDPTDAGNVALNVCYNDGGNIYLTGNITAKNALFTSVYGILHNAASAGKTTLNGNLINGTSSATTNRAISVAAGEIEVNGNISGYRGIYLSGGIYTHNGYAALDNGVASIVNHSGGTFRGTGTIKNLNNNAAAHAYTKSGGTAQLKYLTLIVTHSSAESINAGIAQNVAVQSCAANTAVNVNITQQGGTILVNANFTS